MVFLRFSFVALIVGFLWTITLFGEPLDKLDIRQTIEEVRTPPEVIKELNAKFLEHQNMSVIKPFDESDITLDLILNMAKQVWDVIKENQAVLDVKYDYANGLPAGVRSGAELDNWSPVQYKSFRVYGENGFGITVYDLTYTLVHQYGGTYNGNGQYLESVSVVPQIADVMWGYTVNLGVTKVTATNIGTKENPVANLLMEMTLKVSTVIQKHESRGLYEFRGDSSEPREIGFTDM